MGLDIFFKEDIRNALLAASKAGSNTARVCATVGGDPVTLRAYLEGYRAALSIMALAFGLSPQGISPEPYILSVDNKLPMRQGDEHYPF